MANDDHVAMLKKGVDAWNEWRLKNRWDRAHPSRWPNLSKADLSGENLTRAFLARASLVKAYLGRANLSGADLSEANLYEAYLAKANLSGADLSRARLEGANLTGADLNGANLNGAFLSATIFASTALANVKGLDHCRHAGPSVVDFQTLKNSGPLPAPFLRGVGLPENLIEYLPSLLSEIQHYSCFISYSSKDRAFAEHVHAHLQKRGVRCWYAHHDMPPGDPIIDALDEAIGQHDKVLLILSADAIASDWVEGEVTRALDEERTRNQRVLLPVRIDDAVMQTSEAWARLLRGQRNIGDFTHWTEPDKYQESFERLMRALRVKPQDGSEAPETR